MANSSPSDLAVNRVAKAIARHVPLLDGGHWSPDFTPQWPKDYEPRERSRIMAIAEIAVATVNAIK